MINIIANHAKGKVLKKDALLISAKAKEAKAINKNVIDSTLGTFYYEDGLFSCHNTVKEIMNNLKDNEKYSYSPSKGTEAFEKATISWMFQEFENEIKDKMFIKAIPTPGGTGALSNAVNNSTEPGETVLIPVPCWGPYVGICESRARKVEKFSLFNNDAFNFDDLKIKADNIVSKQNKLVLIINDPCNNPSGYTMSKEELEKLIALLNSYKDVPVVLIYDCAYIDMSSDGFTGSREKLTAFNSANDNVMILIAMSYSKSFFVYGQRLGAQVILSKNEEQVIEFYNAANFFARNTWSNCNKAGISLVEKIGNNEEYKALVKKEIEKVVNVLDLRAKLFIDEAKEVGLKHYPFNSGFFLTIPCKEVDLILDKLVEEELIYLIPVQNGLRVAICSLPLKDIKGLAGKIKKVIDKYDN